MSTLFSAEFVKPAKNLLFISLSSKELYHVLHQPSNFYMLGSMGMAAPIGLGVALNTPKRVYVVDGDGSILMNPGTLATVALTAPGNLTLIAIDNGAYGSTGNQPTHTSYVTDLSGVASGFGVKNIQIASNRREIFAALKARPKGPKFIHILAKSGNAMLENIPLGPAEIKSGFMGALQS